jgi:chemotaxis protein methyltransferase CheR
MSTSVWNIPTREALSARDFDRIRKLAYDYCGLDIEAGKEELVASRLGKVMRKLGINHYGEYFEFVVADKTSQALINMIDVLTTNHTCFFREQQHFDFLTQTILPVIADRAQISIWSSACSTGEEPYSIAFTLKDYFGAGGPTIGILATDISTRVLETAKRATFEAQRVKGLMRPVLQRHFLRGQGKFADHYRVKPEARAMVTFRRLNLTEPFDDLTMTFPLIFCRNVMIYFNAQTQEKLVDRFYNQLDPGGYLFIGHSESLNRISHRLEYVCPAIYRKPGSLKSNLSRRSDPA